MDTEAARAIGSGIANFGWAMAASVATVVVGNAVVRLVRPNGTGNGEQTRNGANDLHKQTVKGSVVERIAAIEATNANLAMWFERHEKNDHENFIAVRNDLKAGFSAINERLDRLVMNACRQPPGHASN